MNIEQDSSSNVLNILLHREEMRAVLDANIPDGHLSGLGREILRAIKVESDSIEERIGSRPEVRVSVVLQEAQRQS